jgi:hypothetical protein
MLEMRLPLCCPACAGQLSVQTIACTQCETKIEGKFHLPALFNLSKEDQKFILDFIKNNGSPKRMAISYNSSYHLIRRRLDEVIARIEALESDL